MDRVAALLPPLAPQLAADFPEIENSVRLFKAQDVAESAILEYENNRFTEDDFYFVDPSIFEIFTFPLKTGNPESVLASPWSIVMTPEIARKYFGNDNPIGKIIKLNDEYEFTVTGILEDIPKNTQIQCPIMAGTATMELIDSELLNSWGHIGLPYNYLLVNNDFSPEEFEQKLPEFLSRHIPGPMAKMTTLIVQPLSDIYLHSNLKMELQPTGSIQYVYLFTALAIAILLIACINFMNLATARSAHRSIEVGMRKTLGANRSQLIKQFLGESIFLSLSATALAFALFEILRQRFAVYLEKDLILNYGQNLWIFPALTGLAIFVGILAGSYPAFFLSRFQAIDSIKGALKGSSRSVFRKILVVFQYVISVLLIISTIIIYKQIHFIKHKDLGFDKNFTLTIPLKERPLQMQYNSLKNALSQVPGVQNVSGGFNYPGSSRIMKMGTRPEGLQSDDPVIMQIVGTDYGYLDALGAELILGRDFSREFASDASEAFIINQAAVNQIGWDNPIGKKFSLPDMRQRGAFIDGEIIGVVRDFHMRSLRENIEPLLIQINPMMISSIILRIQPNNISETLDAIEKTWSSIVPGTAFEYSFIDEKFGEYYRAEEKLGQLLSIFSVLAIFVACLGLFGLASFTTEQRTKEIGIRKVMGASVRSILFLLSKEFLKWVVISNIIAWPMAWFLMNRWLQNFAYHTDIQMWIFGLSLIISFAIAVLTVIYQALKAATSNPVESLRYE
ncbi:ABC transporter permease [bacterium]|nr:ABC transporter permease [bacterium]